MISGTFCMEWRVTEASRSPFGFLSVRHSLVTREKAMAVIRQHGLVKSLKTPDGVLYDTPDGEFKALFPLGLRDKDERYMIERIDKV